jgi:hypothetical protein
MTNIKNIYVFFLFNDLKLHKDDYYTIDWKDGYSRAKLKVGSFLQRHNCSQTKHEQDNKKRSI